MFLPLLLNNVGMSLLNNQRGENSQLQYRRVFWMNLFMTGASAIAGAALVGIFRTHLLRLYGKTFPEGQQILALLLCAAVVEALAMAFYQVIQAEERMWLSLLAVMVPRDVALVLFAYRFAPLYGAFGLGLAQLVAWLLCSTVILSSVFIIGLKPRTGQPLLQAVPLTGVFEGDSES
jgi:hypothetical protein